MPPKQTKHTKPQANTRDSTETSIKTQYLVLYNLLNAVLWIGILLRLVFAYFLTQSTSGHTLITPDAPNPSAAQTKYPFLDIAYPATWSVLQWTQSLAVLEIVHAALGLVRTSPVTTCMQVASRLLLVWGIVFMFGRGLLIEGSSSLLQKSQDYGLGSMPGIDKLTGFGAQVSNSLRNVVGSFGAGKTLNEVQQNQAAYVGMLLAWSVTEVIRYLYFVFYAGTSFGVPRFLSWLRYNTFFMLYPLGISCECWLIYRAIPFAAQLDERYALALKGILAIYVPGKHCLCTHRTHD